ncbi:hypothetical protein, partial [Enterobacter hormaechei]
ERWRVAEAGSAGDCGCEKPVGLNSAGWWPHPRPLPHAQGEKNTQGYLLGFFFSKKKTNPGSQKIKIYFFFLFFI